MSDITLLEAINLALHHEMASDPDVVVLGEDVGVNGALLLKSGNYLSSR